MPSEGVLTRPSDWVLVSVIIILCVYILFVSLYVTLMMGQTINTPLGLKLRLGHTICLWMSERDFRELSALLNSQLLMLVGHQRALLI